MSDLFDLSGRLALVTGASGRLGRAFADALADAGAAILLTGRDKEGVSATAAAVGPATLGIHPADLREEAAIERLFAEIKEHHGGLDVLVNNAGIARQARFGEVTAEDFAEVLAVNVTATFLCAQHAAPLMRARGGGKIVNVGSIYGSVAVDPRIYDGVPGMVQSSPPYAASKSALLNLTRDLAVRLAPWNIQVNLVSPGGVEADQPGPFRESYSQRTPAGRMARAADISGTVTYLAAPASDYVTGQNILVDGGLTAW
jgi:gluconate 5-dehydrogenase